MSPPCPGNPKFPGKKLPETEQGAQTDAPRELDNRHARARTRGDLRETLDPLLTPRNRQKTAGRAKGSQNYNWSPAADAILVELVSELELSKAKRAIFHRLEVFHGNAARTRLDAYRKAIERRMASSVFPPVNHVASREKGTRVHGRKLRRKL